jgi:hypothetical protein
VSRESNARITTATTAATALGGLAAILYGIAQADTARSIGLTMTGLTAVALVLIHRWIADASDERHRLAASQYETQQERRRYIALQAALANEQGRLHHGLAVERLNNEAALAAEREAMEAEFEAERGNLIEEAMDTAVLLLRAQKSAPDTTVQGKVIRFPGQEQSESRERVRGHNAVGP